jgi:hypothetical protein
MGQFALCSGLEVAKCKAIAVTGDLQRRLLAGNPMRLYWEA